MNHVDKLEILIEEIADATLPIQSMHRVAKLLVPDITLGQVAVLASYYRARHTAARVADPEVGIQIIAEWLRDHHESAHSLILQAILHKPFSTGFLAVSREVGSYRRTNDRTKTKGGDLRGNHRKRDAAIDGGICDGRPRSIYVCGLHRDSARRPVTLIALLGRSERDRAGSFFQRTPLI